jgi:muconolactone delta-isomerase
MGAAEAYIRQRVQDRKKRRQTMRYLVIGSGGPALAGTEEMIELLEDVVLPSFEALNRLESQNTILGGGIPVGERAVAFIVDAGSNEELDQILRNLPFWGILDWQVTPLQSFDGRAFQERKMIQQLKKG